MKTYVHYELVRIDFTKNIFQFYNIELSRVNKKRLQLITRSGKLGNKGRSSIILELGHSEKNLEASLVKAKERLSDKKKEGYMFLSDVERMINPSNKIQSCCDSCGDFIKKDLYMKINKWARNEGGWDRDTNCAGYKKVLCINCQIKNDIYKKRVK